MDIQKVLQSTDKIVFAQKKRHLDNIEEAIIKGAWENQSYKEIGKGEECDRSESRVRNVAQELWKILSQHLGEDINKSNFRSTFKRLQHIKSSQSSQNICNVGDNNSHFSQVLYNSPEENQKNDLNTQPKSIYHDLTQSPKIINFYNRETELTKLYNAIFTHKTPLISILGLSGIGKTTLVKRFIDLNLDQFEVIFWKSLKFPKSLDLLINDFLHLCEQEPKTTLDDKLNQFFHILNHQKCLIILDDVQHIFISGELTGEYQTAYQDYQTFFHIITTYDHQSTVILISQKQCPEMQCLDEELQPLRCLELSGIDHIDILNNMGLESPDDWLQLIKIYEGNPLYLKSVAGLIKTVFAGKVDRFLTENNLIITKEIKKYCSQIFNRLSPIEKTIILEISKLENPLLPEEIAQKVLLSSTELITGLQSLHQRYVMTTIEREETKFNLSPVFREYVRNYCQD